MYIIEIYINGNYQNLDTWQIILFCSLLYPLCYDTTQMLTLGPRNYFGDTMNYNDVCFIWSVITVLFLQKVEVISPDTFVCKFILVFTCISSIIKTFLFLRIFSSISYLVTMIFVVVVDLQAFLFFYVLLVIFMSNYMSVLGLGNPNVDGIYRDSVISQWEGLPHNAGKTWPKNKKFDHPEIYLEIHGLLFEQYMYIPRYVMYILNTFNVSVGNFDFGPSQSLNNAYENYAYWILWTLTLVMTNIIFLNFIIAEASNSYAKVMETLEQQKRKERSDMINESEFMAPRCLKNDRRFPRYIVSRTILN
jgi:hypothetical protein